MIAGYRKEQGWQWDGHERRSLSARERQGDREKRQEKGREREKRGDKRGERGRAIELLVGPN
jgi:hypothetical protein